MVKLEAGAARAIVEWDAGALAELGVEGPRSWRLALAPEPGAADLLRVLSGRFEDGRTLALATLRPAGAPGHGEEARGALIGDGQALEPVADVLVSTELDGEGRPRRLGIELTRAGSDLPLRIGADLRPGSMAPAEDAGAESFLAELRQGRVGGFGVLELARPR